MRSFPALAVLLLAGSGFNARAEDPPKAKVFRAGAASVDVSPRKLPALVNGGFLESRIDKVQDPLAARSLVLDDGSVRLAIVVVDSCMMPRELLDKAKQIAHEKTGIPTDRILVSATHTHSAPAAMGALGCAADADYVAFLPDRIAESISRGVNNLKPARIGWSSVDDYDDTHCRRWIRRPDRKAVDPFGQPSARANMHPGYQNPDAIAPSGPVDPELSVLAVQTPDGKPLALLANYSMHYFGDTPVSADYYGRFATKIKALVGAVEGDPPFVGMMSQGTSGDQHWMDYSRPQKAITVDQYADAVARSALQAYRKVVYQDHVPLAMAESTILLRRRVPDAARLAWARPIVAAMGDRAPRTLPEVYAREAIYLHDDPERELKLQALRVGEVGIAAIPDEVFALTGLKLKARSPFPSTFTMELANGSEGYIPPPEQHVLGGYTTWPARTAALEVTAEPKILDAVLGLLETVSGRPRRVEETRPTAYSKAVLAARPVAFWRLEEMDGQTADDSSGLHHVGTLSPGFARFLEGPEPTATDRPINHSVHLAGGKLTADIGSVVASRSVAFWFWNGLPADARSVTGLLVGDGATVQVGIGGNRLAKGRLFVSTGKDSTATIAGKTEITVKHWHHLTVTSGERGIKVYLDGQPEIDSTEIRPAPGRSVWIGGGDDPDASFEGKVDEIAVFDRTLTAEEVASLHASFKGSGKP